MRFLVPGLFWMPDLEFMPPAYGTIVRKSTPGVWRGVFVPEEGGLAPVAPAAGIRGRRGRLHGYLGVALGVGFVPTMEYEVVKGVCGGDVEDAFSSTRFSRLRWVFAPARRIGSLLASSSSGSGTLRPRIGASLMDSNSPCPNYLLYSVRISNLTRTPQLPE